jgi:ferrochelatase
LSFQSKGGYGEWLEPSTDETIVRLADEGCKNLLVVPISFVSDHIETLYEIGVYFRDIAVKHGMSLKRCEALNISEKFIIALKELVMKEMQW